MNMYSQLSRGLLLLWMAVVTAMHEDPAAKQIIVFLNGTSAVVGTMTTASGSPIDYKDTVTLNKRLIFNEYFMDTMTHFVRERTPERVVHAKGAGAFGYFEVTDDLSDICKAKVFSKVGKRTLIAARFSTVTGERGSSDVIRDTRGFALKFYTEDGNFDIVGFSTPIFGIKDPVLFPSIIRVLKRNPATNLKDATMFWDFLTLNPEVLHLGLYVFGDRGIPDGYRHMPGYGIHTFQVTNKHGHKFFIRFHFKPDAGIKNLYSEEAEKIAGVDPDYAIRDLYNAIALGNFPSWTCSVQVLTEDDVKTAGFDVFDITKILPLDKYPLRKFGRIVLNKNPINYFAEIEQLAFSPANLVPGIQGGVDKAFEARRLAYRDAQYHRLGANFYNIPVNCPFQTKAFTYNRDGAAPVNGNQKDIPNYYPNSFHGPAPYEERNRVELIEILEDDPNNFDQARDLYVNEFTPEERKRLVDNMLPTFSSVSKVLKDRVIKLLSQVHEDLGHRIRHGLQVNRTNCG